MKSGAFRIFRSADAFRLGVSSENGLADKVLRIWDMLFILQQLIHMIASVLAKTVLGGMISQRPT
jgi:hypothetical protein